MAHARECLCIVMVLLLGLAGCDNTSVAFCSGGDEFCDNFFLKLAGDEEPEEDDENDPDAAPEPTPVTLQSALEVASLTPRPIAKALAYGRMSNLATAQPDLVGLWLVDNSLARLRQPNANAATTRFLDQNRAWLSVPAAQAVKPAANRQLLGAGLQLYAAFAAELDPASAELGRALADSITIRGDEPEEIAAVSLTRAAWSVVAAAQAPERCCSLPELVAAAVILCASHATAPALSAGSTRRACALARREQHDLEIGARDN